MRVLHLSNTNNIGYKVARSLREFEVESTLLVNCSNFIMRDPSWESPELVSQTQLPDWIRYYRNTQRHRLSFGSWNIRFPYFYCLQQSVDLACLAGEYCLLQAYNYNVVLCLTQLKKLFIAFYIGGDLNVTAVSRTLVGWLMRRAYRCARFVFYSNINMITVQRLELRNAHFMPLSVNTEKYVLSNNSAVGEQVGYEFLLFSPTRHAWKTKGNDKLIYAFAQLMQESNRKIKLILCAWGEDLEQSCVLSCDLKVEDNIVWRPLMLKRELIRFYHASDIILNQFNLGAFGLTTLEAMACEKPVVLHFTPKIHEWCFPEHPSIVSACTEQEIYQKTVELVRDAKLQGMISRKSREWFKRYHSWERIADLHIQLYQELLAKRCLSP